MRNLWFLTLVPVLAACSAERAPSSSPPETRTDAAIDATPASPVPDRATSAPSAADKRAADGGLGRVTFAGYGDVRFGTPAAGMEQAWGGKLKDVGKDFNDRCYFMTPLWVNTPSEFNFMISEGKFARFGTESANYTAPGGGKVGMTEAALQTLYDNGLKASPHKYTDGKYLSINASGVAPTKLVFETDANGVVTEWRVGLAPEIDYVEGCS